MRGVESEGRLVKREDRTPRMWPVESEMAEEGLDLFFFEDCSFALVYHLDRPGNECLTLPMNAEKSAFRPSASTKVSQQAVPAGPDIAKSRTLIH